VAANAWLLSTEKVNWIPRLVSNSFEIEWPPRSGRLQTFPEIDRAEWFDLDTAKAKILSGQVELIDRLVKLGV
jgi:predicted NUDIX family NTP pyrophosphohydrolase